MLLKLRKRYLLLLGFGLLGCTQPAKFLEPGAQTNDIRYISPIDAEALSIKKLIGYDLYQDRKSLHAIFAAAKDKSSQTLIAYLHSEDNGLHWSEPIEIGNRISSTLESSAGNDVQIAADGKMLMAMWQVRGELPGMGPLVSLYSSDGGKTWTQGANPTASETDQSHPDLVADSQGRFHVVWLDDRDENGYQGIRYARSSDGGQHWDHRQTVDDSSCSCCWNRLLPGPDNQLYTLYRDMEPRDMALAISGDAGQAWRRRSTVGEFNWVFDGCPHNGGALTISDSGSLHSLVWTGAEHKAGLYYLKSADNGKTWSPPQPMGLGTLAFHSDLAALDEQRLLAIWDARGEQGSVVMISTAVDGGNHWARAKQISSPGSSAVFPRLMATASGFLAMWLEQKPGGEKQWLSALIE